MFQICGNCKFGTKKLKDFRDHLNSHTSHPDEIKPVIGNRTNSHSPIKAGLGEDVKYYDAAQGTC